MSEPEPKGQARAVLEREKETVAERFGPWTAHNVHLGEGVYTRGPRVYGDEHRLRRVVQAVADLIPEPVDQLRVLDLGCLEGLYAIEFAARGAEVVGIEGRERNIERARFARRALGLEKLELLLDDVRNLSRDKYGDFDVVLCIGILYHLDAPDVFEFIHRLSDVCTRLVVIDTHVALRGRESRSFGSRTYRGISFVEHSPAAPAGVRERSEWASLDNACSFWLTRAALLNTLGDAGFTTVCECRVPALPAEPPDRITLLAVKGRPQELASTPVLSEIAMPNVTDVRRGRFVRNQSRLFLIAKRVVLGAEARWFRLQRR
jgi:SAM-dependent methyltransferase